MLWPFKVGVSSGETSFHAKDPAFWKSIPNKPGAENSVLPCFYGLFSVDTGIISDYKNQRHFGCLEKALYYFFGFRTPARSLWNLFSKFMHTNCTTELKLTTSSSAPVGSYVINVTGKNKQYQGTTSFTLSVTQVPTVTVDALRTSTATPTGIYTVTATGGGVNKATSFDLTVNSPIVATVATPSIIPHGGSFVGSASVTLQTTTSGASIYYTTDGSMPTQSSTLYTVSVNLTSSATVKVIAVRSGSNPSTVESASFTVVTPPAQLTSTCQGNSTNGSNFGVERKTGTDGTYTQIALVSTNTTSYVDTGVTHGVTYCYRVNATNGVGTSTYVNEGCASAPLGRSYT